MKKNNLILILCIFAILGEFFVILATRKVNFFDRNIQHRYEDEVVTNIVSANLTRKIFPPSTRLRPLINDYKNLDWFEYPKWQHIPPLYTYVPLLAYKIDGQVSFETKRLSYFALEILTALALIIGLHYISRSLLFTVSATLASLVWLSSNFTQALFFGFTFNESDILLSFFVVLSYLGICHFFSKPYIKRKEYSLPYLMAISAVMALPLIAKSVLGGIPALVFFTVLLFQDRNIKHLLYAFGTFVLAVMIGYLPLFLNDPALFLQEIRVPFQHFGDYQTWARPWNFFLTDYLPKDYYSNFTLIKKFSFTKLWPVFVAVQAIGILALFFRKVTSKTIVIILGYLFVILNILAISLVKSKSPNFAFQSYLIALFLFAFQFCAFLAFGFSRLKRLLFKKIRIRLFSIEKYYLPALTILCSIILLTMIAVSIDIYKGYGERRAYMDKSPVNGEFYYLGNQLSKDFGINDLLLIQPMTGDYTLQDYLLFFTGAETRRMSEFRSIAFNHDIGFGEIKNRYQKICVISKKGSPVVQPLYEKNINGYQISCINKNIENNLLANE